MSEPQKARQTSKGRLYEWTRPTAHPDDKPETFWSVTTIIKGGVPAPALMHWGMREVAEYAVANADTLYRKVEASFRMEGEREEYRDESGKKRSRTVYRKTIEDPDKVTAAVDWLKGAPYRKTNRRRDIGSTAHDYAEALALDKNLPAEMPEHVGGFVDSFLLFCSDWRPTFEMAEASVYSRKEQYAGTLDAIAVLPRLGRVLLDYKTGKGVYSEVALQLAAYRHAEFIGLPNGEEAPMPEVDGAAVLHLTEDGYALRPVVTSDEVFDAFRYVREVFRWQEETSKGVLGQPLPAPADL